MCVCSEGLRESRRVRITEFQGRGGIRQEGRLKREKTPEATEPVLLPPVGSQVGHGKGGGLRAGQEAGGVWFQDSSN